MKKMMVTMLVQTEINFDEMDDASYEEELEQLISDLEDMGLTVSVESEETLDDDSDSDLL